MNIIEVNVPAEFNFLAPTCNPKMIRVGNPFDGGYVVPKIGIENAELLVSLGISSDWSFDQAFQELNSKVQIIGYDHTISFSKFSARAVREISRYLLGKSDLSTAVNAVIVAKKYKSFFSGRNKHVRKKIVKSELNQNELSIKRLFGSLQSKKMFLKIDIEGSEYEIISEIIENQQLIDCMVIEFHDIFNKKLEFIKKVELCLEHYHISHVHVNNCGGLSPDLFPEVLEITFLRRDVQMHSNLTLPINLVDLDGPNNPLIPDYKLIF
jgi:hypothetical protein